MDNKFLSKDMINLYPLQKTLCFELRRIDKTGKMSKLEDLGSDELESLLDKTLVNFENNKIIEHAEKKANNLETIKDLLDSVHIDIIKESLEKLSLDKDFNDYINKYDELSKNIKSNEQELIKNKKDKKKCDKISQYIYIKEKEFKQIKKDIFYFVVQNFKAHDKYEQVFSDERLKLLEEKSPEQKEIIYSFNSFMSYFKGYDRRLKYLYEDEEEKKYTAYKSIPYLLTNYNLPIFYKNFKTLEYIKNSKNISKELKNILLKNEKIRNIGSFSYYITESGFKEYNKNITSINQEITKYNNGKNKERDKFSHLGFLKNLVDLDQDTDILRRIYDDKELVDILNKFICGLNLVDFKAIFNNIDKKYNLDRIYIKNGKYLMETLELNKDKKINKSYIKLYDLKYKDKDTCKKISNKADELLKNFYNASKDIEDILKAKYDINDRNLGRYSDRDRDEIKENGKKEIQSIEVFLKSIKALSEFVSLFMPKDSEDRYLTDFDKINFDIYNRINHERLAKIDQIYNHVKAYFTLKNFSTKKIRLNFDEDLFLDSWDINQIDLYLGTILIKEEEEEKKYFLGIVNRKNFSKFEYVQETENAYQQMICKYVASSNSDSDNDEPNDDQVEDEVKRYRIVKFKNISQDSVDKMVENDELYLFQFYNKYFSKKSYRTNKNLNMIYWDNIFDEYNIKNNIFTINGEAKLFYRPKSLPWKITHKANVPITNKDENNPKKESTFGYDLIKDKRYTENKLMIHIPITINNNSQFKEILDIEDYLKKQTINQGNLNKKILELQNYFKEQTINQSNLNKKIMEFQDYLKKQPINQNTLKNKIQELQDYLKKQPQNELNRKILEKIRESADINIIAISRSRDDLLHATIMDLNGDVKESISLSKISSRGYDKIAEEDKIFEKDYNALINKKEQEKIEANKKNNTLKEWQSEKSIKDFLTGYTSQIVNKIVQLVKEYNNSIIVFEESKAKNLKDSKFEGSLYRDLVKAIITKLSFLADKKANKYQHGSTLNAYQLAYYEKEDEKAYNKSEMQKIDKAKDKKVKSNKRTYDENIIQNGIVFHNIPAKLTSEIDMDTGFINCFCLRDDMSIQDFGKFIESFDNITLYPREEIYKTKEKMSYDEEKIKVNNSYAFTFKYENFKQFKEEIKNKDFAQSVGKEFFYKFLFGDLLENIKSEKFFKESWTLYSCIDRMDEKEDYSEVDISKEFSDLFKKYSIIEPEKINDEVLKEFHTIKESYNLKIDNYSIKCILRELKNSSSFKQERNFRQEFDEIFASDNIYDKNSKTLELLKKYHILNLKKIDKLTKDNKKILQQDEGKDILYYIIKESLDLIDRYQDTFFEIQDYIQKDIIEYLNKDDDKREEFCKEFIQIFKLMLQMRNYDKKKDYEYVLSPVGIRKEGALKFFNSNSDENASKNVAKKGLLLVKNIKEFKDDLNTLELKVDNEEWITSVIGDKFFVDKQVDENDDKNQSDVIDKKIDENEDKNQSVKNIDNITKETKEKEEKKLDSIIMRLANKNNDNKNRKNKKY